MPHSASSSSIRTFATQVLSGSVDLDTRYSHLLAAIARDNPKLNCFTYIDEPGLAGQLSSLKSRIKESNSNLPLAGVPVAVKDNICTRTMPTTCGSRILSGYVPPYDATVVLRLKEAGAIVVGKANLDEFGMGSTSENSAYGPVRNPWDPERVAGGSSGGSAAAVSAGLAAAALGSDTGGSVRLPANYCGLVGFKPSYGAVSRYGLVAYASSLDQVGPMGESVEDVRAIYEVISGLDPLDSTSVRLGPEGDQTRRKGRIGVLKELNQADLDPEVRAAMTAAMKGFEAIGYRIEEFSVPELAVVIPAYYVLATAEASANLARYDGVRFGYRAESRGQTDLIGMYEASRGQGFGPEVRRRILVGTYALSAGYYDQYYGKAAAIRVALKRRLTELFASVDYLLTPCSTGLPPRLGEVNSDPVAMYTLDLCTTLANLTGIPALAMPAGVGPSGMPIGFQIMGPFGTDMALLDVAAALEKVTPHGGPPPLFKDRFWSPGKA